MKRLVMRRGLLWFVAGLLFLSVPLPAFSSSQKIIRAKAFVMLDEDDAVLFAKNAEEKLAPASTVKLMTAMVALDILDPETCAVVSSKAAKTRSSRPRLRAGDELTVEGLLHLALMKSTNSAAVVLAEAAAGSEDAFVDLMNRKAGEIGAHDTHFENASGLPTREKQFTTARDLTIILKQALTYPLIREIIGKKQAVVTTADGKEMRIGNTDALLWYRDDMVGGKTGFTNRARHCFVGALETENGMVYTAVLGAPSRSGLWSGTQLLASLSTNTHEISSITTADEIAPSRKKARKTRKVRKPVRRGDL